MTLHVYRSQRVEDLASHLATYIGEAASADPFEFVPVVVGSRGMERWLRHELGTEHGCAAALDFPFPGPAFDACARWLLGDRTGAADTRFWKAAATSNHHWSGHALSFRILSLLRQHIDLDGFAAVRRYLGPVNGNVTAREIAFAQQVGATIERLYHDRHVDAVAWESGQEAPAEFAWIARLTKALHDECSDGDGSPAEHLYRLENLRLDRPVQRSVAVFGLGMLRPGDKKRFAALARHIDVHFFTLAPSREWYQDIRRRCEQKRATRHVSTESEVAALLDEFDRRNSMLASNGSPSRDLQAWLETVDYVEAGCDTGGCHHATPEIDGDDPVALLTLIQSWIDRADDNPSVTEWSGYHDRSIQVHATHGALRQCEALRDELLRRFHEDPTLEPRHVLVMTPDVPTYAPLVAAVFARTSTDGTITVPEIPVHVADLGLRATNSVADALLHALALADERVTASRLLDFAALRPVRQRFEIAEEELADLKEMVVGANLRWGWNAVDRERYEQPALDQNTVRFGLERLALGVLMPDPGGLGVVGVTADATGGPAVPWELATRDRAGVFGRFAAMCDVLERASRELVSPADASSWQSRLNGLLDQLTLVEGESAWLRAEVADRLRELLPDRAPDGPVLDRSAVVTLLTGAFEVPEKGDRPVTGAVTMCAMEPMRSVPFRVVAVIGLDDQVFPRSARTTSWDPFSIPRFGEYDRRAVDRHLFLEAMLCARDAFLLFGTGFEPKRGAVMPLSVVATELIELLGGPSTARFIAHALQPWSPAAFRPDGTASFDGSWARAGKVLAGGSRTTSLPGLNSTPFNASYPLPDVKLDTVTADELAQALIDPHHQLLSRRLGIALGTRETDVADREPIETDSLEAWGLRDRVLRALQSDQSVSPATIEARLSAEGLLPIQGAGKKLLKQLMDDAGDALVRARDLGTPVGARAFTVVIDDVMIAAVAADTRQKDGDTRLVWATASSDPRDRIQLTAWITLLAASAVGEPVAGATVVGYESSCSFAAVTPAEARRHLATLVGLWQRAQRETVLLFPVFSRALAEAANKSGSNGVELFKKCRREWEPNPDVGRGGRKALDYAHVAALFDHVTVEELAAIDGGDVLKAARSVWDPLIASRLSKSP